jgi:hypothetical protein
MRRSVLLLVVGLTILACVPSVSLAHVPQLPGGGGSLSTAIVVKEPTKSWAIYEHLHEANETVYFRLEMRSGDRLWLSLLTPETGAFTPSLAIMGPGIADNGTLPARVERPPGAGVLALDGSRGAAEYEPFTPGAYYFTVEHASVVNTTGTYYVAVYSTSGTGAFSLAVGLRESFTLKEWTTLPLTLLRVYRWEGHSWAFILGPPVATIAVGLAVAVLLARSRGAGHDLFQWMAILAGLLSLGTAANVTAQMLDAAATLGGATGGMGITLMFILLPAVFGLAMGRTGLHAKGPPTGTDRVVMVVLGALSIGLLAGYIIGPAIAFAAALLPERIAMIRVGGAPAG